MSAVAEPRRRFLRRSRPTGGFLSSSDRERRGQGAPPRIGRRAEQAIVWIGIILSTVTLGGFALVMNEVDQATFEEAIMPVLVGADTGMPPAEAFEAGRTLSAWFGVSLILVLLLSAAGILRARTRPEKRSSGGWFLAAGLVCLLGSQLILYPIAFVFFVAAGLFALRPVTDGSPS